MSFGDPEYDGPYLRANRGDFDGPERVRRQTDFLVQILALESSDKILDAGCGIGTYTHELAKRGFETVGLDVSATFLAEAEKRQKPGRANPRFRRGSFGALEALGEESSVVIITAAPFFKDVEELRYVTEQVFTVLSRGGRFLFDYSNWPVRSKVDEYPQTDWWRDGDAFVLLRNDWNETGQCHHFEWYRIDLAQEQLLSSRAQIKAVAPSEVVATVEAVGFTGVAALAKWEVRPFDGRSDRGFVLVAKK